MTANGMRNLFKELYDGASAQEMGFDDIEVSRFLNLSQDLILKENFYIYHNKYQEGFEQSNRRDMEFKNLKAKTTLWFSDLTNEWNFHSERGIIETNIEILENNDTEARNSVLFKLPNEVLYILQDTIDIRLKGDDYKNVIRNIKIKNIDNDKKNYIFDNPFTKPDITVIYREIEKLSLDDNYSMIRLYLPDEYEMTRYNLSYLRRPLQIKVNILDPTQQVSCVLDEVIHNDIVFKAVELAMGSIGSQKFQIATYNTNKNNN